MAVWIEMDTNIVLRLVLGQHGTAGLGVFATCLQVINLYLKMDLHLLLPVFRGPDRTLVHVVNVKGQADSSAGVG